MPKERRSHLLPPPDLHTLQTSLLMTAAPSQNHAHTHECSHHHSRKLSFKSHASTVTPTMSHPFLVALILALMLAVCLAQQACTDTDGCFPPVGNLALGRTVSTNSSCTEGELLCPLFLVTPCVLCPANSSQFVNDGDNSTFWASQVGSGVKEVGLRLDFESPVLFQDTVLVWKSVRPIAMMLERSCDYGATWSVYRYYALDCSFYFGMPDTHINSATPTFGSTAPICTSVQSELFGFDFSDALVTFSTSEHSPVNADERACYGTITNLRVVLVDLFPELRLSNTSFQYYGIREWIVRGSCACNGHSGSCVPAEGEELAAEKVYTGCQCEHNTEGPSCNSCTAGFNNLPYEPGTSLSANACQECTCNGHAPDCVYNQTLGSATCVGCMDNTVGAECQECASGYFQDMSLLLDDPNVCRACGCDPSGITNDGDCNASGACSCKMNVGGAKCSECLEGFFNFSAANPDGCQECTCNSLGAELTDQGQPLCNGSTGECLCLATTEGEMCDGCRSGSFDFASGCQSCACNPGGSRGQECNVVDGQCPCKVNLVGRDCSQPAEGFYARPLDEVMLEAEDTADADAVVPQGAELGAYTGTGFALVDSDTNVTFDLSSLPRDSQYQLILRISYVLPAEATVTVMLSENPLPATTPLPDRTYAVPLVPNSNLSHVIIDSLQLSASSGLTLTVSSQRQLLVDSLVVMPDVSATSRVYASANVSQRLLIDTCLPFTPQQPDASTCDLILFTLSTEFYGDNPLAACQCSGDGSISLSCNSSGCSCKSGVTGFRCDRCGSAFFNFSSVGCEACTCDEVGSTSQDCSSEDGICPCKAGVSEPLCDSCRQDFYNFTSEGCSPCSCSEFSMSPPFCNATNGQCTCLNGVTGRTCDTCLVGFFGLSSEGCQSCDCDPFGSLSSICNEATGQCSCAVGLGGRTCDVCSGGFFYTAGIGGSDSCRRCVCSGRSSSCSRSAQDGRLLAVLYNFTEMCSVNSVGCGSGWDIRTDAGDQPADLTPLSVGFGYLLSGNDNPLVLVAGEFLGDRTDSYGQNFTAELVIRESAPLKDQNLMVRLRSNTSDRQLLAEPYYTLTMNPEQERVITLTVLLEERSFSYVGSSSQNPTLLEFLSFLTGLSEIGFTADYTVDFIELNYVRHVILPFTSGQDNSPGTSSPNTVQLSAQYPQESCACDDPYQGQSCELCARGYYRPSGSIIDPCLRCECNNQTLDCDSTSGLCLGCGGNSTGSSCERCLDGFYGDPTRGIPCQPCNCPLVGGGFSATCSLNATDGRSICDNCSVGYTGRNCEICMEGFFGNPLIGRCTTCGCNGNVDPALGPVCDMTNGRCLNCLNNTHGFECEICMFGYYGDPGNGIPCQPCPCDPRGSDSYCDPLYGTCFCLPNIIPGGLCSECEDGFFNITEGVGCSSCNCDPVRSTSSICNKVTGDCACHTNVGSSADNKCTACTPGFFNFSTSVGCEACGCSALSVSQSCDQVTGSCDCQEGAVGEKCDDCAFGFTGKVPNCEPCHECYFQWYNLTNDVTVRVDTVNSSSASLLSFIYGSHTVASISSEASMVLEQLQEANSTLDAITFNQSSVNQLRTLLYQLNTSIVMINDRTGRIMMDLIETERLLNISNIFDGTLNMTDVVALRARLDLLNATVFSLSDEANGTIVQLRNDQRAACDARDTLDVLNSTAVALLARSEEVDINASRVLRFVDRLNRTFFGLRRNLSRVDMAAMRLERMVSMVVSRAGNITARLESTNRSSAAAMRELRRRERDLMQLRRFARRYNSTVSLLEEAAGKALQEVEQLQVDVERSLNGSNELLLNISRARTELYNISRDFRAAVNISQRISGIVLPSDEAITRLADRINTSMVSDEVVMGIMANASLSVEIAANALDLAQSASNAVLVAIGLARSLQVDIDSTTATQYQVNQTIAQIQQAATSVQSDLTLIEQLAGQLDNSSQTARQTYSYSLQMIQDIQGRKEDLTMRVSNLSAQAYTSAAMAAGHYEEYLATNRSLNEFRSASEAELVDANRLLEEAQGLLREARELEANATRISPQDIISLAEEYNVETQRNDNLLLKISNLTEEMTSLTQNFQSISGRLKKCYRTP